MAVNPLSAMAKKKQRLEQNCWLKTAQG